MKKFLFLAFVAVLMMAAACNEPLDEAEENTLPTNEGEVTPKMSHRGNKEPIPYTIPNMKLALAKLQNNGLSKSTLSDADIRPTHVYLKFFPSNMDELIMLKSDHVLDVVPVPYDCDLEGFDGNYHDPEVPADKPTYYYSVVEVGHPLPNVRVEVLDSLFMPDLVESNSLSKRHSKVLSIWPELECEAIRLSGFDTTYTIEDNRSLSKRYKPSGEVASYDNIVERYDVNKNYLFPVPNVRVHANFSTHKSNGYTDISGHYEVDGHYTNKVHTHVYFESKNYGIYEDDSQEVAAYYYGRNRASGIAIQFKQDNEYKVKCSAVARAAYWCYNWRRKLSTPTCTMIRIYINGSIQHPTQGTYDNSNKTATVYTQKMKTKDVSGVTIAQLAQSMLVNAMGVSAYNAASESLVESWGIGVSNILTRDLYRYYLTLYKFPNGNGMVYGFPFRSSIYTHFVSDLEDDDKSPGDNVSNIPIHVVEECIISARTLQQLCNNLKSRNPRQSKQLDELYSFWINYR
ncbi:MAG: hypothetical protein J6T60_01410 [Bacteroidales bacterium]|nr:hypothetical protein [Bacteroidales bacterium]